MGAEKRVTLLRLPVIFSANSYSTPVTLPIGIAYIASYIRKHGFDVQVLDSVGMNIDRIVFSECRKYKIQGESIDKIISDIHPESKVLGITIMFSQEWPFVRDIIKKIKRGRPDCLVVVGGEHVTAMTEYSLRDCPQIDYAIKGEGEIPFLELCKNAFLDHSSMENLPGVCFLKENQYVENDSCRIKEITSIPWPAWDLMNLTPYFQPNFTMGISHGRNMPLLATRGCPYQCTFCSSPTMWTTRYVMRDPRDVADEIEYNIKTYQASSIDFYDLTAIVQKKWIMDFTQQLLDRKIKITWSLPSGTRSEVLDEEVISRLKATGMELLVYAPESSSEDVLKKIKKKINFNKMVSSIKLAKKYHLIVKINWVIGFPSDRRIDIYRTLWTIWKSAFWGVNDADLATFSPYPGSELFRQLKEEKVIGEINDSYFESLLSLYDFTEQKNYCKQIGLTELSFYRVFGMGFFYILSYASHPQKLIRIAAHFFAGKPFVAGSIFEQRVFDLVARFKLSKHRLAVD
jgi:radical SAM superfamily enzyme YgiQ (UPF0313 family)